MIFDCQSLAGEWGCAARVLDSISQLCSDLTPWGTSCSLLVPSSGSTQFGSIQFCLNPVLVEPTSGSIQFRADHAILDYRVVQSVLKYLGLGTWRRVGIVDSGICNPRSGAWARVPGEGQKPWIPVLCNPCSGTWAWVPGDGQKSWIPVLRNLSQTTGRDPGVQGYAIFT